MLIVEPSSEFYLDTASNIDDNSEISACVLKASLSNF